MWRLVSAIAELAGAGALRRAAGGLVLVVLGSLVLGGAAGFAAFAAYQSLLVRFVPWQAACLVASALALLGGALCWAGSRRLRSHPSMRDLQDKMSSLVAAFPLFGTGGAGRPSPMQVVTVAAIVGFVLGRRR